MRPPPFSILTLLMPAPVLCEEKDKKLLQNKANNGQERIYERQSEISITAFTFAIYIIICNEDTVLSFLKVCIIIFLREQYHIRIFSLTAIPGEDQLLQAYSRSQGAGQVLIWLLLPDTQQFPVELIKLF